LQKFNFHKIIFGKCPTGTGFAGAATGRYCNYFFSISGPPFAAFLPPLFWIFSPSNTSFFAPLVAITLFPGLHFIAICGVPSAPPPTPYLDICNMFLSSILSNFFDMCAAPSVITDAPLFRFCNLP